MSKESLVVVKVDEKDESPQARRIRRHNRRVRILAKEAIIEREMWEELMELELGERDEE